MRGKRRTKQECIDLFWSHVIKSETGCWQWTGRRHIAGYGQMVFWSKQQCAHRISWIIHNGEIPGGLHVLHKCDNPPCCNPDHLFLGTQADNDRDRDAKGRTRPGWVPGSKNGCAKLTESDIPKIRSLLSLGIHPKAIGPSFGVGGDMIARIRDRKNWRHVPEMSVATT